MNESDVYGVFLDNVLRAAVVLLWVVMLVCFGLAERGEGQDWSIEGYRHSNGSETYTVTEVPQSYWDEKGNLQIDILNPYPRQWTVERHENVDPTRPRRPCPDR